MSDNTKFRVTQDSETKKTILEVWRKFGENKDDWVLYEKLEDISVSELKELRNFLINLFIKSKKEK
jgi:hypothetical protein